MRAELNGASSLVLSLGLPSTAFAYPAEERVQLRGASRVNCNDLFGPAPVNRILEPVAAGRGGSGRPLDPRVHPAWLGLVSSIPQSLFSGCTPDEQGFFP
jgi:hypothetical protein